MKAITIALGSALMLPASLLTTALALADQSPRGEAKDSSAKTTWIGGYRYSGSPSRQQPTRTWTLRIGNDGSCLLAVSESTLMREVACTWSAGVTSVVVVAKERVSFGTTRFDEGASLFRLDALATGKIVTRWLGLDEGSSCGDGEDCFVAVDGSNRVPVVPTQVRLLGYQNRLDEVKTGVVHSVQSVGSDVPPSLTSSAGKVTSDCNDLREGIQRVRREAELAENTTAGSSDPRRELLARRLDLLASSVAALEHRGFDVDRSIRAVLAERAKKTAAAEENEAMLEQYKQAKSRCKADVAQCHRACKSNSGTLECVALATAYANGDKDFVQKRDIRKAGSYAMPACRAGVQFGCNLVDAIKESAAQCSKVEACKLYCDAGLGEACSVIGGKYINGDGVPVSASSAFNFRLKGCDYGSAEGCLKAGIHYMQGWGIPKNWPKAEKVLARCCEMKEPVGCQLHAELCWKMGTCR